MTLKCSILLQLCTEYLDALDVAGAGQGEGDVQDPLEHHAVVGAVHQPDYLAPIILLRKKETFYNRLTVS